MRAHMCWQDVDIAARGHSHTHVILTVNVWLFLMAFILQQFEEAALS